MDWEADHPGESEFLNPYSIARITVVKKEFEDNPEQARKDYEEIFYYYDGMLGSVASLSLHPAGIIIAPFELTSEYGTFLYRTKNGAGKTIATDNALTIDMEPCHDLSLAKYDFLVLKTVGVIKDTCELAGIPVPRMHEIDWNNQEVWRDIIRYPYGIFQFEENYAFDNLRKMRPTCIKDMSMVTAAIRPAGASYRNELIARKPHQNPSPIIDEMLKDNLGYLIYQEDTIKFLQEICGLSGSRADSIRRGIGRKKREILDDAMPEILNGYCSKSSEPREVAEEQAKEFLQIIEDSASYQFGYNHSMAYCMIGYMTAMLRYEHPVEFITAFLNNAKNDEDFKNGELCAKAYGYEIFMPKWKYSRATFFYDKDGRKIYKGISSLKGIGEEAAEALYNLSQEEEFHYFSDLLFRLFEMPGIKKDVILTLINIDYFSEYGNQRELLRVYDYFVTNFGKGKVKQIKKDKLIEFDPEIAEIIVANSNGMTKSGKPSANYTQLDLPKIMREIEKIVKKSHLRDLSSLEKFKNFEAAAGYAGFVTGLDEDKPKMYITGVKPLVGKDGKVWTYSLNAKSVGSGKESMLSIRSKQFKSNPVKKGDFIHLDSNGFSKVVGRDIWNVTGYEKLEAF